jgi:hypothetical protein
VLAVVALAVLAGLCVASPSEAKRSPAIDRVLTTLKQKTGAIHQFSLELGEDILDLVPEACGTARLSRFDPDKGAESQAFLDRAVKLAEEGLQRDFDPAFVSGGDYARLEKQIDALGETTSGVQRHEVKKAALYLEAARLHRKQEADYIRRTLAAQRGLDCEPQPLLNAFAGTAGSADTFEHKAIGSLNLAAKSPKTVIRKNRPLEFRISVTYTVTYAHSELANVGNCQVSGQETGSLTETASFPPITVLPNGRIKAVVGAAGTANIAGTWSASGYFYPGNDCGSGNPRQNYTCGGQIQKTSTTLAAPNMILAPRGSLANLHVDLPQTQEASIDSCPNGSDHDAYIPPPLDFPSLSDHAASFEVPLDGVALRQRLDPATIENGILHLGPALPPADCTSTQVYYASCSNQGSRVHVVVHVEPVSSD